MTRWKALVCAVLVAMGLSSCDASVYSLPLPGGPDVGEDPITVKVELYAPPRSCPGTASLPMWWRRTVAELCRIGGAFQLRVVQAATLRPVGAKTSAACSGRRAMNSPSASASVVVGSSSAARASSAR